MPEALIIRTETRVAAPPATVFAYLTDPEKILRWMGTEANVEPHVGGIYQLNVSGRDIARGRFIEVIPVHRLAYSFGWDKNDNVPPESSLIEIDLVDEGDGTLVRLTHSGLPDPTECANHEKGWNHYLGRLAVAAPGGNPGPDVPLKG